MEDDDESKSDYMGALGWDYSDVVALPAYTHRYHGLFRHHFVVAEILFVNEGISCVPVVLTCCIVHDIRRCIF